jgi:hypothetical protein
MTERTDPAPPHAVDPNVNRKLEAICMKCLERQPRHRYATAAELADDLARWRKGQTPRPARRLARIGRFARRHRVACAVTTLLICVAAAAPAWRYFRSPERRYQGMLEDLRAGRPVQFLGETGRPPHCEWIFAGDEIRAAEDGAFSIECGTKGFCEIVDHPQCERFRLRLQIRQDQFPVDESIVGIFFGYHASQSKGEVEHRFCTVTVNPLLEGDTKRPHLAVLKLHFHRWWEPSFHYELKQLARLDYVPSGKELRSWRDLMMDVTPEGVAVLWENQSLFCPVEQLNRKANDLIKEYTPGPSFNFDPKGGIGFFAREGVASYRNVTIEPLPVEN